MFIFSRIYYCNNVFTDLPKMSVRHLQLISNPTARIFTNKRKIVHITPVHKSLHWLSVALRICFKILLLVFKSLNVLELKSILKTCCVSRPDPLRLYGLHTQNQNQPWKRSIQVWCSDRLKTSSLQKIAKHKPTCLELFLIHNNWNIDHHSLCISPWWFWWRHLTKIMFHNWCFITSYYIVFLWWR